MGSCKGKPGNARPLLQALKTQGVEPPAFSRLRWQGRAGKDPDPAFQSHRAGTDQIEVTKGTVVAGRPGKGIPAGRRICQSAGEDRTSVKPDEGMDPGSGMDDDITVS